MISDKLRGQIKASKMVDQSNLMHLVTGLSDKKQTVTKKTLNWSLWIRLERLFAALPLTITKPFKGRSL